MAWRMQSAFPSWLHAAPRLHWLHVAGELGLTHAPATEDDFQRFIELHRRQIRSERVEADNADVLQRRASEIANRILPRILELSGTTREAFAAQFDNGEDRKWLGL
jgi:hypothetical protein